MTAAHRAPLHVVPDNDTDRAATEDFELSAEPSGETIAARWEPENQLLGALLWMPYTRARTFCDLIPDTAIWRPMNGARIPRPPLSGWRRRGSRVIYADG